MVSRHLASLVVPLHLVLLPLLLAPLYLVVPRHLVSLLLVAKLLVPLHLVSDEWPIRVLLDLGALRARNPLRRCTPYFPQSLPLVVPLLLEPCSRAW